MLTKFNASSVKFILIFLITLVNTRGSINVSGINICKKKRIFLASLICGLASLFYLYEFSLQVSPSL